jgi:RNA polymerase sigma factor (sigma-70 family)
VRLIQTAKTRRQERDPAFAEIVRRFQDMAYGCAYALVGDVSHAQDIAQEAFMEAWSHIEDLHEPEAFPGWFRQIVLTRCHRYLRRKRMTIVPLTEAENVEDISSDPLTAVEARESALWMRSVLRSLPEDERILLVLFHLEEYSYRQIALFLDLPISTVDNRLRAARRRLKERVSVMVQNDFQSRRPSRDSHFVDDVMGRPPDIDADTWAIMKAADEGDLPTIRQMLSDTPELLTASYAYWQPLHFAARAGHAEVVQMLLDAGADPLAHIWGYGYANPLEAARDRGHEEVVGLLETAIKERHRGEPDRGALICGAVASGDVDRIRRMLDEDPSLVNVAEIVSGDEISRQPLHVAVEMNRFDLVDLLIERGADLEGTRGDGFKPIHVALWKSQWRELRDNWAMAGYLLARGAAYSIGVAAARNDLETVRRLVEQDTSLVNFPDTNAMRPLSCAAERGHAEMVRFLLDHGADPNLPEANLASRGYALWVVTRRRENVEIARMLLEAGADVNASFHASAGVYYALVTTQNEELRQLLYEHGAVAGLGSAANEGRLDLCAEILAADPSKAQDYLYGCAIHQGHLPIVKLMMRHGARLDPHDMVGPWRTALGQCLEHRRIELAEFLIEHGADINRPSWFGYTPLHNAIMRIMDPPVRYAHTKGSPDMVEWALDHGVDIEARDWQLESRPLAWAAHVGSRECVEALVRRGACVHHPEDQPWNTPIARAEKQGHTEIAEFLRSVQ